MAQAPAILRRIRQAIDMINTKSINQPVGIEPEQGGMRRLKDWGIFDTQACQAIDVEEAAPVDLVAGCRPPGEAIVLPFQQLMDHLAATRRCRIKRFQPGLLDMRL